MSLLQLHDQNGRQQLRVINPKQIGVCSGATGCLRRWEGPSRPTGQLPPASSWAAPSQLGADSPQSVCLNGCLGLRLTADKQTAICAPHKRTNLTYRTPALRVATWNVRTMCSGLSDDLQLINETRKTAIIDRELERLKIDIAALQETRIPSNGSLREKNYTFFWQGHELDDRRLHGVGFAVRNTLLCSIE